jgi:hypothetical protein
MKVNVEAGTIRTINLGGGAMNCVNCAIATDALLAGRPATALLGGPYRIDVLERVFGAKFSSASVIRVVIEVMRATGSGSRGIVYGVREAGVGHVFNVVNQNGIIRFLDGQTGRAAELSGYVQFRLLRTN